MDKDKILKGIKTCSEMSVLYHNGYTPGKSFDSSIKEIRDLLGEMLEVKQCKCKKRKK